MNLQSLKFSQHETDTMDYRPPFEDYIDNGEDESELLQKDIKLLTSFEPELLRSMPKAWEKNCQ